MSRETLGLVGAACLITGWVLASTLSPPVARSEEGTVRRAAPAQPAVVVPEFDTLRERMRAAPGAPRPQRNPFVFEAREAPPAAAAGRVAVPPPPAPTVTRVDVALVGIAADQTAAGLVRTAILADGQRLWLLTAGETLPDGRAVARIDEDAVVLADPSGLESVLRLR